MRRPRRPVAALALALGVVATLSTASCGVEPGDSAPTAAPALGPERGPDAADADRSPSERTTTTRPPVEADDLSPMEEQMVAGAAATYEEFGLAPDDARCLAEAIIGAQVSGEVVGELDAMAFITECGIGLEDLAAMSEALGGTPEEALRRSMQAGLENQGMSEEDATCVVEAYLEEYGATDQTSFQDLSVQVDLFRACDVDLPGN